jgi:outer membrane protein OmpA-like peptidoglycan-associated protein
MRYLFVYICICLALHTGWSQALVVEPLSATINSKYDEITPVVQLDGKSLFFTRVGSPDFDHTLLHNGENLYVTKPYDEYLATLNQAFQDIGGTWTGELYKSSANQDIWFTEIDQHAEAVHLSYPINNALPNSVLAKTNDPSVFYTLNRISAAGTIEKGISYIQKLGDGWSFPAPVEIEDFYTITSEVSLTISFDGRYMLLSAKRSDAQDLDIYLCTNIGQHKWSAPRHLGPTVNSAFRETAPSISDDGKTLYFTSNRGGDNDVYYCLRHDDTWLSWSTPKKMDAPINSPYDDGQPSFNSATGKLYFASRRNGSSDIYQVKVAPPQALFVSVQGRILNDRTGEPIKRATVYYTSELGKSISVFSEDGTFSLRIPRGQRYVIRSEKAAYTDAIAEVHFKNESRIFDGNYVVDLAMSPFGINEQIVLNPFYFTQSKANLLDVSKAEVIRLASILKENPSMTIRIEGHTDNLGKMTDLQKLSNDRAVAIKTALVEQGISGSRMETIGFGGARPYTSNETDDDRKKNRRVEIIITKI